MTTRLVERLKKELTPQLQGYVAKTVGESPAATAKAVDTAIATLFSGVAAAADTPDGLATLLRLVSDPVNDGTLLNQLPALYQGTMTAAPIYRLGSQLLHQVFGGKLGTVNQSIATLAGVKPSAAAVLTTTLAPHVLAIIGRDQRASGDLSAAGLARLLAGESAEVSAERGAAAAMMAAATALVRAPRTLRFRRCAKQGLANRHRAKRDHRARANSRATSRRPGKSSRMALAAQPSRPDVEEKSRVQLEAVRG